MSYTHQLTPGQKVDITKLSTSANQFHTNRQEAEAEFKTLRKELVELQRRIYAEDKHKILIVFQAMDAGGKDGTIRVITRGVNPQGVGVTSFKVPSKIERAHDFLWRIHNATPAQGMIRIFNRSHYEDVLVVRVENIVPESVWRPRYKHINQFEKLLSDSGTTIFKFYLHISKNEQRKRFQDRIDEPSKHWKFSFEDLEKRKQWDDYMAAYGEMLQETTTPWASWNVVPADQKWYRNLAIMRVLVNKLNELSPQYPVNNADLSNVVIG